MMAEEVCRGGAPRRRECAKFIPRIQYPLPYWRWCISRFCSREGASNRQVVSRPAPGLAEDWMTSPGPQKHAIHAKKRAPLACSDGTQLLEILATTQHYFCKWRVDLQGTVGWLQGTSLVSQEPLASANPPNRPKWSASLILSLLPPGGPSSRDPDLLLFNKPATGVSCCPPLLDPFTCSSTLQEDFGLHLLGCHCAILPSRQLDPHRIDHDSKQRHAQTGLV